MKKPRVVGFVAAALVIGFLTARWSSAQTTNKDGTDSYIGLQQLESFVAYLQSTGQTNTLQRFNDFENTAIVTRDSAELGMKLHLLYNLREGRTNEAIRLLELGMAGDAVAFAASYRELPASIQKKVSFTALREARDYCRKYPVRSSDADMGAIMEKAFSILDEKSGK